MNFDLADLDEIIDILPNSQTIYALPLLFPNLYHTIKIIPFSALPQQSAFTTLLRCFCFVKCVGVTLDLSKVQRGRSLLMEFVEWLGFRDLPLLSWLFLPGLLGCW